MGWLYGAVFLSSNEAIVFCCVPSHVGIGGDEKADLAAKGAHDNLGILYTELKFHIDKYRQDEWNNVAMKNFIL